MTFMVHLCRQRYQQYFCMKLRILGKMAAFPKITTISTESAILNSMSNFMPKYWQDWHEIVNEFLRQR